MLLHSDRAHLPPIEVIGFAHHSSEQNLSQFSRLCNYQAESTVSNAGLARGNRLEGGVNTFPIGICPQIWCVITFPEYFPHKFGGLCHYPGPFFSLFGIGDPDSSRSKLLGRCD